MSSFSQSYQIRQINISCNEIYGIMHILVSECISKGLNEEKFALLNTAKKWKKMFIEKNDICVLQCYHKTTLKIMKKKVKFFFLITTHHYFSAT